MGDTEKRLDALEAGQAELRIEVRHLSGRDRKVWAQLSFREKAKTVREWAHTVGMVIAIAVGGVALFRMPSKEALAIIEKMAFADASHLPTERESADRLASKARAMVHAVSTAAAAAK